MKSFLDQVADHLVLSHTPTQLSGMALVVPSRRAAYFLQQALANRAEGPFLAPAILAMDDFMQQTSHTERADGIELLFDLFEVFKSIHPDVMLEKFMGWGPILLKDFDLIDQYAVEDPERLFAYVSEAKALERWGLGPGETASQVQKNYFTLYDQIRQSYHAFAHKLQQKGRVYRGLAYRLASERVSKQPSNATPYHFHYFIGLNALSKTEEVLIKALVKENRADCLWDADVSYVHGGHRAGVFLRRYQKSGLFGKTWKWLGNSLAEQPKNVHFIPVNAAIWQPQLAAQRYTSAKMDGVKNGVGWILNDESLLPAVLQALPSEAASVNITMGLSLRQSAAYSFLNSILTLQLHAKTVQTEKGMRKIPMFTPNLCRDVYQNPLYAQYRRAKNISEEGPLSYLEQSPKINNAIWQQQLAADPLGQLVFSRWPNSTESLVRIMELLHELRGALVVEQNVMEIEFLFTLLTVCQRLGRSIPEGQPVTLALLRQLLTEVVRQERVPFAGEPVAELQIMSMLETRCLDFDKVSIFHTNEGFLPSAKKVDSLIPIDLAREYGLPIYSDQDSVMAYHFFRLLQRSKDVDIYYIMPSGKGLGGGKEPSRFIRQLEQWDLPQWNKIHMATQKPADQEGVQEMTELKKTDALLVLWKAWLGKTGLTPTSLDVWMRCQRKFVFKYLWKWREVRDEVETIGADVYGQLIHKLLEVFFEQHPLQNAQTAAKFRESVGGEIDRLVQEYPYSLYDFSVGYHALIKKIAINQVEEYLDFLIQENKEHQVENMEFTLAHEWPYSSDLTIPLSARVDQRERVDDTLSLIDFKTGSVEAKEVKADVFAAIEDPKFGKLRQLWMYQYLLAKKESNTSAFAKIISLRNPKYVATLPPVERGGPVNEYFSASELFLTNQVDRMLNPDEVVAPASELKECLQCGYRLGCGRG